MKWQKKKSILKMDKNQFFKRQTTLSEIGEVGQQKLQDASVLVVGCGGLGSPIAVYLAASGIGKIHLVDFDTVATTNLHRQVFYDLNDVGKSKAEVLSAFIKKRAPFTVVNFTNEQVTKETIFEFMENVDIVVDGTDSLPTKYLLNDACVVKGKPLVYGSLYKFDGYVATFNVLQKDGSHSANLRDAFPEMTTDIPNCETAGTLNGIVGMIAMQQVNEVLKLVTGIGSPLVNTLLIYNSLENTQLKMTLLPSVLKTEILKLFETQSYLDAVCAIQRADLQISPTDLKEKIISKKIEIIAVLSNLESPFKVHQTIPITDFDVEKISIDFNKTYVIVCQRGLNSYKATKMLKKRYPALTVLSLTGGVANY